MQKHGYKSIAPGELKEKLDRGENMVLLDVREPWEFTLADCPEGRTPGTRPSSRSRDTALPLQSPFAKIFQPLRDPCSHPRQLYGIGLWSRRSRVLAPSVTPHGVPQGRSLPHEIKLFRHELRLRPLGEGDSIRPEQ